MKNPNNDVTEIAYDPSHSQCGNHVAPVYSRRGFLAQSGLGIGMLALGTIFQDLGMASPARAAGATGAAALASYPGPNPANPLAARTSPLPGKAKHVIHIFAGGAPSHIDTWDPKPALEKYRDQSLPGNSGVAFPSPFTFTPKGKSGLLVSSAFPQLGNVADELCVVRSMYTDIPAHGPATRMIHTGNSILTRPSLGSWIMYGLGTDNLDLPGFVALGGDVTWRQAAFLPSLYQGARSDFGPNVPPEKALLNLKNEFSGSDQQRMQLDLAKQLDGVYQQHAPKDEQLDARIQSFELAFRMQTAATDAFDIHKEPEAIRQAYGETPLGAKLLCARRLVERGVRFVQIDAGGWDHHTGLEANLTRTATAIDQPAAALIADLKQRGLLESTLVIWGGEFGRTATTAGRVEANSGRDHHADCFSLWMAGGGVKGGEAYGSTDELGQQVATNGVHVHDLHATIMRAMGFDHTRLTYRYDGRDFRLTDNYGKVVNDVLNV